MAKFYGILKSTHCKTPETYSAHYVPVEVEVLYFRNGTHRGEKQPRVSTGEVMDARCKPQLQACNVMESQINAG